MANIDAFPNDPNLSDINTLVWKQLGEDIDGEAILDYLGNSVSLNADGTIVDIGAILNDDNGNNSGNVRVYQRDGNDSNGWSQIGEDIDGEAASDESGYSVSLSATGDIVAIGARFNDDNGTSSGHVIV